jgi:hypothetical protein
MFLVKVATLHHHGACTGRRHRQVLLLTIAAWTATDTTCSMHCNRALSLHVEAIRWLDGIIY